MKRRGFRQANHSAAFQPGPFINSAVSDYDYFDGFGNWDDETEHESRKRQKKALDDLVIKNKIIAGRAGYQLYRRK